MNHVPTRIDLIKMLPQGARIAEIGVYRGVFSKAMLDLPNLGHLFLVDAWKTLPGYSDPLYNTNHEENLEITESNIRGHLPGGRVSIIRKTSFEAAQQFKPGDLNAVYLDANHSYDSVFFDLNIWSKVVKPDGVIMGHDYTENETAKKYGWGVIPAVAMFCQKSDWFLDCLTEKDEYPSFLLRRAV